MNIFSVVKNVFGYRDGVHTAGAMNALAAAEW
ncbi:NADP-dependent malic enzyme [Escherichia coli]|uniref:NADP-dependent malic enzyme n=1 Tax=Escherichia coli TaxID=562 RepID=A0A376TUE6_ECOLX|nr:NADP-dependent malic enzyme [Escherichia coli]